MLRLFNFNFQLLLYMLIRKYIFVYYKQNFQMINLFLESDIYLHFEMKIVLLIIKCKPASLNNITQT